MLIVISIIDTSVIRLSYFLGVLPPGQNIIVFLVLVLIYAVGQYFILNFIKSKIDLSKIAPLSIIHRFVLIIQYFLILLFAIIIMQMILTSSYSLIPLKIIVYISGGSSIMLLGFIAKKFFAWFKSRHDAIVISYAIAMGVMSINIVFMMVIVTNALNVYSFYDDEIKYAKNPSAYSVNKSTFSYPYVLSSALSFIIIWIATVLLLGYYSKKFGRLRYWLIVSAPLFYFLFQYQGIFFDFFISSRMSSPILYSIITSLLFTLSKPIGGFLFGIGFWMVSKRVNKHKIRDYLIITAFGIALLITSNQTTSLISAPYPPFGLMTASLMTIASYLFLVGIYSSAMSISRDAELRKFIQIAANKEIKLLDSIGFAQVEQGLVTKVLPLVQQKAKKMEQETGIRTSLTDSDMKQYLEEILAEVRSLRND